MRVNGVDHEGEYKTNGENVNTNIYKYNIEFSDFKGNIVNLKVDMFLRLFILNGKICFDYTIKTTPIYILSCLFPNV